jgi:4'-phosphopantetheinyl transferase
MDSNRLYLLNTDSLIDKDSFDRWYPKLPLERRKRIDTMKVDSAKCLCLGAGILLHTAMADLGITDYRIGTGEHGKPYLIESDDNSSAQNTAETDTPNMNNIFFNISHSGTMAVLALSDREAGVDIEEVRHFKDNLVNYAFNEGEIELAWQMSECMNTEMCRNTQRKDERNASEHNNDLSFTRLWTFKESVMKYTGTGIAMGVKNIRLRMNSSASVFAEKEAVLSSAGYQVSDISASCDSFDLSGISFTEYAVPGYALTVCSEYSPFCDDVQIVEV